MADSSQVVSVVITVIIVGMVGMAGLVVMEPLSDRSPDELTGVGGMETIRDDSVDLGNPIQSATVKDSSGVAIQLTGTDGSYVSASSGLDTATASEWEGCTWVAIDSASSSETMDVMTLSKNALLQYNGSAQQWVGVYWNSSSRSVHEVSVGAPTPTSRTHLCFGLENSQHITIHKNASEVGNVSLSSQSGLTNGTWNASNLDGWIDETRTFEAPITSGQRSALYTDPIDPLPGSTRAARLMYDEGSGETLIVSFEPTSGTLSNGDWVDGLDGSEMVEGADYNVNGNEIVVLDGGELDGAPRLYVSSGSVLNEYGQVAKNLGDGITSAYNLLGVAAIVLVAMLALGVIGRAQ